MTKYRKNGVHFRSRMNNRVYNNNIKNAMKAINEQIENGTIIPNTLEFHVANKVIQKLKNKLNESL